jgi:hypothetical protein
MTAKSFIYLALLATTVSCTVFKLPFDAASEIITVEGQAPIDSGSIGVARSQALQDAELKALQQNGTIVNSHTWSDTRATRSTLQMVVNGAVSDSRIIEEHPGDHSYHVTAAVDVNRGGCDPKAIGYRKKLAVTAFPVLHAQHISDIRNVASGYPTELIKVLDESGRFILRSTVSSSLYENPLLAPEFNRYNDRSVLTRAAENLDAQFVITGIISDMEYIITQNVGPWNVFYELFDIPPLNRKFRMELYLYDGLTGVLLDQFGYEDSVVGSDVYFKNGTAFRNSDFLHSSYGEAITAIIRRQASDIIRRLNCLPLAERIVRIDENDVYVNAGAQSNVRVGDTFIVYHEVRAVPGVYNGDKLLGYPEEPKAMFTVRQVQPKFSIGYLDVPVKNISPNDFVRSW